MAINMLARAQVAGREFGMLTIKVRIGSSLTSDI
jgi:hypothetical protein